MKSPFFNKKRAAVSERTRPDLPRAGYNAGFTPLADAVKRYVTAHLDTPDRYR